MKKVLSILLVFCMLFPLSACKQQEAQNSGEPQTTDTPAPEVTPEPVQDAEILAAIEAGLVPEAQQGDYEAQVDYRDFCALLDALVEKTRPEKVSEWAEVSADFRDADKKMTRVEGMVLLLYAAECMEVDQVGVLDILMLNQVAATKQMNFWEQYEVEQADPWSVLTEERIFRTYYDETIANSDWSWRCEDNYYHNAMLFACYVSYASGKTYFDYDENGLIHPADVFTRAAAIHAVERLYETTVYVTYGPYNGERFQLSADALRKAEAMPDVAYNSLPNWHGQAYDFSAWMTYVYGKYFSKEKVDLFAELGYNFIRTPLDVRDLFDGSDTSRISAAWLQNLDNMVEWCAQKQIHLCIGIHSMPGFVTGGGELPDTLFTETATQELFADIWAFLAEHYADVPVNMLSFNLLNEPHISEGQIPEDLYVQVMIPAIDAIRTVTPDRLIFVDVISNVRDGDPVEALAGQKVVQAVHSYPHEGTWQYPSYQISPFINKHFGALEFRGSFPAGTTVKLKLRDIDMDSGRSVLSVVADGKVVETFTISEWSGEKGPRNNAEQNLYTATLKEPASSIRIEQSGGEWYAHRWIALEADSYTTQLVGEQTNRYVGGPEVPVLTIAADGTPAAAQGSTLYILNRDSIRAVYEKYREFTERTGEAVMVQEFGYNQSFASPTACAMADDYLEVLDELGIPWCIWDEDYGPTISKMADWWTTSIWGISALREGGNYQPISEHYLADMGLLEVLQRHMS